MSDTKRMTDAEVLRELAKQYIYHSDGDPEKRRLGLRFLREAYYRRDPEATYLVARLVLKNVLTLKSPAPMDEAMRLLAISANAGYKPARREMDFYCQKRYFKCFGPLAFPQSNQGRLLDFEGKPIRIKRDGPLTPVKAVLEYRDGKNILTLRMNVMFLYDEEVADPAAFEEAVLKGIRAWQKEYVVFGGQKVLVKVQITRDTQLFNNLLVMTVSDEIGAAARSVVDALGTKKRKALINDIITNKRSFMLGGFGWSVRSRKIIWMQSKNERFDNYDELFHVSKHEFGHVLGLGDLYASEVDELPGVERGTYPELDCYAIGNKWYNLVMCDHCGPISNNDIEMVILAFRDNKLQLFQKKKSGQKVSRALGRGN